MNVNAQALVRPDLDSGVPGGTVLLAFADAVIGSDLVALDGARAALADTLGPAAVTAAAAVAANFSKNDRVANALGIPIDETVLKATVELRAELGLNGYRSAANTFRHPQLRAIDGR